MAGYYFLNPRHPPALFGGLIGSLAPITILTALLEIDRRHEAHDERAGPIRLLLLMHTPYMHT